MLGDVWGFERIAPMSPMVYLIRRCNIQPFRRPRNLTKPVVLQSRPLVSHISGGSARAPFRCLTAMPPEGCTRAEILPGCPSLDTGGREAAVGFEPRTFRSVNSRSNHLGHLARNHIGSGLTHLGKAVSNSPLILPPVAPFRCLAAMPPEGSTRTAILPGCPSLNRGSRVAEVGLGPRTFRSVDSRSNHLIHPASPLRVAWQPGIEGVLQLNDCYYLLRLWKPPNATRVACDTAQLLERESTDRKVRDSNLTSASEPPVSRLGQPDSIPALMFGDMAVRHLKGVTTERCEMFQSVGAGWPKWLEREFTDRRFRDFSLVEETACRVETSPSGGMAARHRRGATAERFFKFPANCSKCANLSQFQCYTISFAVKARIYRPEGLWFEPASRLPLPGFWQPGSIPALALPSGGMAARHRRGAQLNVHFGVFSSNGNQSMRIMGSSGELFLRKNFVSTIELEGLLGK
ncbi:hypothetical protein T265_10395 [Opisthorchis viverrini]|uniref:Uncharacterized protein n=1 Tax=Opisthorchis viverrini TaxID=6198 RepID=A0A074ZDF7_OPIVI|nr:hypothetical protein T265_10395 [Opisthorchis viverrini]KER21235.1 hypothetical protein T265_10395 [Opisthorchis viverrini]